MDRKPTINRRHTLKGMAAVGASAALVSGGLNRPVTATEDELVDDEAGTPEGTGMTEQSLYERLADLAMKPWNGVGSVGVRWIRSVADGTVHPAFRQRGAEQRRCTGVGTDSALALADVLR